MDEKPCALQPCRGSTSFKTGIPSSYPDKQNMDNGKTSACIAFNSGRPVRFVSLQTLAPYQPTTTQLFTQAAMWPNEHCLVPSDFYSLTPKDSREWCISPQGARGKGEGMEAEGEAVEEHKGLVQECGARHHDVGRGRRELRGRMVQGYVWVAAYVAIGRTKESVCLGVRKYAEGHL